MSTLRLTPAQRVALAKETCTMKNGQCMTDVYVDKKTVFMIQCGVESHPPWNTTFHRLVNLGSWCRKCAHNNRRFSIEIARNEAKLHHGECLSSIYVDINTLMDWICELGHPFEKSLHDVRNGGWCNQCSGRVRVIIEDVHAIANERGGFSLASAISNSHESLPWMCGACFYVWNTSYSHVKHSKSWCPQCGGHLPYTIEFMHELAAKYGGYYRSIGYTNVKTLAEWECKNSHRWLAPPTYIIQCHDCRLSGGAAAIMTFLSKNFLEFKSEKKWDDCSYKNPLPYDFYIESYNLLIEFDGEHHFKSFSLLWWRRGFSNAKD